MTKAEKTRAFIIEKAAPLFNMKGYAGTSMNDIMAATGLAKGGIYSNFRNKDDIAARAFDYSFTQVKDAITAKVYPKKTAREKLLAILNFYRNYTVQPPVEGGCPLLNTAIDADDAYPFLKARAREGLQVMLSELAKIIDWGIRRGEFRKDLDTKKEAELFYALVEGGIMMAKLSDDVNLLHRALAHVKQRIETEYPG